MMKKRSYYPRIQKYCLFDYLFFKTKKKLISALPPPLLVDGASSVGSNLAGSAGGGAEQRKLKSKGFNNAKKSSTFLKFYLRQNLGGQFILKMKDLSERLVFLFSYFHKQI